MFNPFTFFRKLAASLERIETQLDREKDELPPFNYRDFGKLTFVHQGDGQCCIHGAPDTFPEDQEYPNELSAALGARTLEEYRRNLASIRRHLEPEEFDETGMSSKEIVMGNKQPPKLEVVH